jgi:cytoplasmic iron level regulating protein YaaA (DUF328/UPF0246 family)
VALIGAPCLPAVRASVLVLSALGGVVALDDPMPDHRLKLSVALAPVGRMASFWRPTISALLADRLDGALVIDLLPGEHAAAWTPEPGRFTHRKVRLVGREREIGGHFAKAAKGRLARALLRSTNPEAALRRWRDPEFRAEVVPGP